MINKKICQQCWEAHGHGKNFTWSMGAWPSGEEMFSEEGWMQCWPDMGNVENDRVLISAAPPMWCPYVLEHLMESQKDVEQANMC